eukprot:363521-Chlamydomonas_euryale.AAC.7
MQLKHDSNALQEEEPCASEAAARKHTYEQLVSEYTSTYDSAEQKETGRVWVRYPNGHEAPLEPRLGAGLMSALG